jgi:transcriptional regulator with XRE-family HTH domain
MPARKPRRRAPERGYKLAQARKDEGISQQQLAERTGVAKSTIGRIETGVLQPSVSIALRLARALDSSVELLFGGGGE